MLNKQKVQEFRGEFLKSVEQLEKDFGVVISLGTISFNADELRAKMTARVGDSTQISSRNDFKVGDIVGINHKKVDSKRRFKIDKINSKNIKVSELEGYAMMTVSPSLLF
tara:strand:- start:161 stop:490 length:330 start_codon:yes stop_codon:yes gene_type:complete